MYKEESKECLLIDCSSVGECKTVTAEGSTLIYVSHTNDPTTALSTPHLTTLNTTASTDSSFLPTESSDFQTNSSEDSKVPTNHTDIPANSGEDLTNNSHISMTHGDTSTNDIDISTDNNVNTTKYVVNSTDTLKTGTGLTSTQSTVTSSTDGMSILTNTTTPDSKLTLAQNTNPSPTSFGDYSMNPFETVSTSTSEPSINTGQKSPSSPSSLPVLLSTLLSETSAKATSASSANTAAMNNSTPLGSFSTSSSVILSTLTTNLPINENVTFMHNHSLSVTNNETSDNGTKGSTKILNDTDYNNESTASSTVFISESTSSITPGSTSKQSSISEVPSSHSSSSWWLFNMSSGKLSLYSGLK